MIRTGRKDSLGRPTLWDFASFLKVGGAGAHSESKEEKKEEGEGDRKGKTKKRTREGCQDFLRTGEG